MATIDDLLAQMKTAAQPTPQAASMSTPVQDPVAASQQQPQQQQSWVADLISKRSAAVPAGLGVNRNPAGFSFKPNPFDPSSYYKQLNIIGSTSKTATATAQQDAQNRFAASQTDLANAGSEVNFSDPSNTSFSGGAAGRTAKVIAWGKAELGKPYVFGANGPSKFDCSGLMQYIFGKSGVKLPRTAAQQQRYATPTNKPRAGDLVFYGKPAHHVALYLGNGKMLAAPHTGANVRIQSVYGNPTFGRV